MEIVKLVPECKDNIWGGVKLKEKYGKQTDKSLVAESWELSFHKDGPTRLENGKTLQEKTYKFLNEYVGVPAEQLNAVIRLNLIPRDDTLRGEFARNRHISIRCKAERTPVQEV